MFKLLIAKLKFLLTARVYVDIDPVIKNPANHGVLTLHTGLFKSTKIRYIKSKRELIHLINIDILDACTIPVGLCKYFDRVSLDGGVNKQILSYLINNNKLSDEAVVVLTEVSVFDLEIDIKDFNNLLYIHKKHGLVDLQRVVMLVYNDVMNGQSINTAKFITSPIDILKEQIKELK